jgi:hypothetical protein
MLWQGKYLRIHNVKVRRAFQGGFRMTEGELKLNMCEKYMKKFKRSRKSAKKKR